MVRDFGLAFLGGFAPWREPSSAKDRSRAKAQSRQGALRILQRRQGSGRTHCKIIEGAAGSVGSAADCCRSILPCQPAAARKVKIDSSLSRSLSHPAMFDFTMIPSTAKSP